MSVLLVFIWALISSAVAWVVYSWIALLQNYNIARRIGIPLRIVPISHGNPFWMIIDKRIVSLLKRFPWSRGNLTRYNWRGWEVDDRCGSHLEMGDVYMQVTPGKNWLYICNPVTLMDIFRRRSDFPRPLEIFGQFTRRAS